MSTVKAINLQHPTSSNANIVMDSAGRVGIGTTSPGYKLQVEGAIFSGREDTSNEGGQIGFGRASDNSQHYAIDAYGSGSSPSLRFIDAAAGVVRMNIDSSGRITMPYQPSFAAYATTAFGSGQGTGVYLFAGVDHNVGNCYSTSTGRFTAPVAGRYLFMTGSLSRGGGAAMNLNLRKNASSVLTAEDSRSGGFGEANITTILNLAVNDYVDVYINNSAYGGNYDFFSGHLIG